MQSRVGISELPWMSALAEDRKFRKIVTAVLVLFIVLSVIITLINLPPISRLTAAKTPPRIVKLIKPVQVAPPKPKEPTADELAALRKAEEERRKQDEEERRKREEEEKKLAEQRKKEDEESRKKREAEEKRLAEQRKLREEEQRKLAEEQRKQREAEQKRLAEQRAKEEAERRARAEVERKEREKAAARKAAQDVFGGLSNNVGTTPSSVTAANAPLTAAKAGDQQAAPRAPSKTLSSSTAEAGKRSGGIDTSTLASVETGVSATLGDRSTTAVEEIDLGIGGGGAGGGNDSESSTSRSGQPSRSARELNEIMERYKGRMSQIYQRALRKNPALGGKIVARITILPSGEVSEVELGGDVDDAELLSKLKALIKTIQFGGKDVPTIVANYPIDFAML